MKALNKKWENYVQMERDRMTASHQAEMDAKEEALSSQFRLELVSEIRVSWLCTGKLE